MKNDLIPLVSFVFITTFTPGPNSISSASMGILYGYKKTLPYLLGIASGFFLILLLCGKVANILLVSLLQFEKALQIIGAVYILYLAWHTFRASYVFEEDQKLLGFINGLLLQILNPKVILYGLTLYSSFLGDIQLSTFSLIVSAAIFAAVGFAAISTWAFFGSAIRTYLKNRKVSQVINSLLSLLLVLTAINLSGLVDLF